MKKIREIMTRDVQTVTQSATVQEAARMMKVLDLGSLPVCEGERLMGVLTDREMTVRVAAEGRDPVSTPVREVMNSELALCSEDDDVRTVTRTMEAKGTHRVFATDKEGRLVGIVSLGKVARAQNDRWAGRVVRKISRPRKRVGG